MDPAANAELPDLMEAAVGHCATLPAPAVGNQIAASGLVASKSDLIANAQGGYSKAPTQNVTKLIAKIRMKITMAMITMITTKMEMVVKTVRKEDRKVKYQKILL